MEDKFEQMTGKEMLMLDKAELKIDKELKVEKNAEKGDALIDALGLLDHLEDQKMKLEKRELVQERTRFAEQASDQIANFTGSVIFVFVHIVVFAIWIIANTEPQLFGIQAFDPYPFMFLTLAVSLEAIFLSSFILLSQNRQSARDRKRDEIDFERDRLDLKVDTLAAKTIREATVRITNIEQQITEMNRKLDRMAESKTGKKKRK